MHIPQICTHSNMQIYVYAHIVFNKMVLELEGQEGRLLWWLASASGYSDLWKCGVKPDLPINTGLSLQSFSFGSMMDGNRVMMTGVQKVDVTVRKGTWNPVWNSNDSKSNCSSDRSRRSRCMTKWCIFRWYILEKIYHPYPQWGPFLRLVLYYPPHVART